jgi:glycosyltransferase involved in cell wall biosynthesis
MRVTQVCLDYAPSSGGTSNSVTDFNQVFKGAVITFISRAESAQVLANDNVVAIPTVSGFLGDQYALALPGALEQPGNLLSQTDLLVCHMLYRYHIQWATEIARRKGIPYWVVPHGSLDPFVFTYRSRRKWLWMRLMGKSILRKAACVIFATENEKQKALMQFPEMNAVVVHWPVTVSEVALALRSEARSRVRALYGISATDRVLLYVGRLHESKRPLQTIEAFGEVGRTDFHLLMVGPDETLTREACIRYALEHKISNVHMVGPVYGRERFDYYMAADGYISLSAKENFGYTVAEALACGLPVILSPGNDLAPELRSLHCGWFLDADGSTAAVAGLGEFASASLSGLEEMGRCGQLWAQQQLSPESFKNQLETLATATLTKRAI